LSVNVVIQKSEALMKSSSSATLLMSADIELCIQLCQQAISEGSGLSSEFIKLSGYKAVWRFQSSHSHSSLLWESCKQILYRM